jgi:hypothetical protein
MRDAQTLSFVAVLTVWTLAASAPVTFGSAEGSVVVGRADGPVAANNVFRASDVISLTGAGTIGICEDDKKLLEVKEVMKACASCTPGRCPGGACCALRITSGQHIRCSVLSKVCVRVVGNQPSNRVVVLRAFDFLGLDGGNQCLVQSSSSRGECANRFDDSGAVIPQKDSTRSERVIVSSFESSLGPNGRSKSSRADTTSPISTANSSNTGNGTSKVGNSNPVSPNEPAAAPTAAGASDANATGDKGNGADESSSKKSNVGAIAGGIIGALLGLAVIAALAFWLCMRGKKRVSSDNPQGSKDDVSRGLPPTGYVPSPVPSPPQMTPQQFSTGSPASAYLQQGHNSMPGTMTPPCVIAAPQSSPGPGIPRGHMQANQQVAAPARPVPVSLTPLHVSPTASPAPNRAVATPVSRQTEVGPEIDSSYDGGGLFDTVAEY